METEKTRPSAARGTTPGRRNAAQGGRSSWVDAAGARAHVLRLVATRASGSTDGVGLRRIAEISGVSYGTLSKLVYGRKGSRPSARIGREAEEKILSVGPEALADGACMDAAPTRELVGCLVGFGFRKRELAGSLGKKELNLRSDRVRASTARAIEALHWRLWLRYGPLRFHCRCVPPRRINEWLEEGSH